MKFIRESAELRNLVADESEQTARSAVREQGRKFFAGAGM
jgi:hypothetical protein